MKAIIILILSFLLFSFSISAEGKNGVVAKPTAGSEIKVPEERINGIENQIKALQDKLAFLKSTEKWYLFGAVLLGALLGFLGTEVSARRRLKEKRKILTNDIIADTIKFICKTRDIANDIIVKKKDYLRLIKVDPSAETKSLIFKNYADEMDKGFFTELNHYSFQLKRLNDQEIYNEFETLIEAYEILLEILFKDNTLDNAQIAKDKCMKLLKEFTDKCIKISKV
jgi:hypothetical protein